MQPLVVRDDDSGEAGESQDQRDDPYQQAKTMTLIDLRRRQYRERTGRDLTDENVWVAERLRELHSLQAILDRLTADQATHNEAIARAGTANRIPLQTSGHPRCSRFSTAQSASPQGRMTVTTASLLALQASARKRSDDDTRIGQALKTMRKRGLDITVSSLARHAGVSRRVIHRRTELRKRIRTLQPLAAAPEPPPPPATDSESSIIAALRTRMKAREAQITELNAPLHERDHIISTLHGELARKS
ncbi:hypothetical protein PUR22_30915 [Mycolicibacterium porcinum]|nr:hypothetical protein [Mycobacterium dioxanotrophicus]